MLGKIWSKVNCPECGAPVGVEFTVTEAGQPGGPGNYTVKAVQSAPMVCECGFTYAPTTGATSSNRFPGIMGTVVRRGTDDRDSA